MKKTFIMGISLILALAFNLSARDKGNYQNNNKDNTKAVDEQTDYNKVVPVRQKQAPAPVQPVVIRINESSSGGHDRNYPSQRQQSNTQQINTSPSYGTLQWHSSSQAKQSNNRQLQRQQSSNRYSQPSASKNTNSIATDASSRTIVNPVSAIHHRPYENNYIRKKLKNLGVTTSPGYITNRKDIVNTDRSHSTITFPSRGIDERPLNATTFSSRKLNDKIVKSQMNLIMSSSWKGKISNFNQTERTPYRYYWHKDKKFNYCHYIDGVGYHWYGWYMNDRYFWTRHYNNRWWWYDADYDRWCFWNNNFWWWQDPYHIGDLYCYNNINYIPLNSANDNVAVSMPDSSNVNIYTSPDNTRKVKLVADTHDAFLYDNSNPPTFDPIYLGSGGCGDSDSVCYEDIKKWGRCSK
ncbi:MAG: hypothetical protein WCJ46_05415 [bacterium]